MELYGSLISDFGEHYNRRCGKELAWTNLSLLEFALERYNNPSTNLAAKRAIINAGRLPYQKLHR